MKVFNWIYVVCNSIYHTVLFFFASFLFWLLLLLILPPLILLPFYSLLFCLDTYYFTQNFLILSATLLNFKMFIICIPSCIPQLLLAAFPDVGPPIQSMHFVVFQYKYAKSILQPPQADYSTTGWHIYIYIYIYIMCLLSCVLYSPLILSLNGPSILLDTIFLRFIIHLILIKCHFF
jgi:hypothetical protein